MPAIPKPAPGEYGPYYAGYIQRTPADGALIPHLRTQLDATLAYIAAFPAETTAQPHAPGEWTIREILIHLSDSERIFAYRLLRIARGDQTPLPGFEQDDYVPASRANTRSITDILAEYRAVRHATLALLDSLATADLMRQGTASSHPLSVRAAAHIIAGHELHHLESIRENYGG
jgi:uncharacterized damage-inducible protein DinB